MIIVLVTPRLDVGGSQRYISEIANSWAEKGHNVIIINLRTHDIFYDISDKITIFELGYHHSGFSNKVINGFMTIFKLRKTIKTINPNFVLSVLSSTNILTIISTLYLKPKLFVRDAFSHTRKRSFVERMSRKYLYKKANGIIAQSNEIMDSVVKETGHNNVKVIHNPVREFKIAGNSEREKIILNVGALIVRKGQKYFIQACSKIDAPDWKFAILGEGLMRKKLEKQIKELNLQDRIELVGSKKYIDDWLLKSSIFVFPSLMEGMPNALIEAMAAGIACISFDCDTGPRDIIIDGKNGFLVPIYDVDLLIKRIEELINDSELRCRISSEGRKIAKILKMPKISEETLNFCKL